MLDLFVAVGVGVTLSTLGGPEASSATMAPMGRLPLSLIPGFLVPLFLLLHVSVALQVRAAASADRGRPQPSP